jgi:ribonuclease HI
LSKLKVFTDGASRGNPGESGIGIVVTDEKDNILKKWNEYLGKATNNQAEYKAIIKSLEILAQLLQGSDSAADMIEFYADSELMVKQLRNEYKIKNPDLKLLHAEFTKKVRNLGIRYTISHVERDLNKTADKLANQAIDNKNSL